MNANCNTQTLFDAIQNSDVEQVKTLLNDGICPNSRNETGLAALTLAASIGNADVIIALIRAGATTPSAEECVNFQ